MLAVIYQPLPLRHTLLLTFAVIAGVTVYCLAYTALSGVAESPVEGVLWASVHVVPFLLAFEVLKRGPHLGGQIAVLAGTVMGSVGLDALVFGIADSAFEVVRRLPSAGIALLLAKTGPLIAALRVAVPVLPAVLKPPAAVTPDIGPLPWPPGEIDWVAAAGNYVELHAGKRTVLHRAPLAAVEVLLASHGFVRIHRSRLVARRAVAKLRSADVVLQDGMSLKIGTRYRAALVAALA